MTRYVLGFMFSPGGNHVVLIKKDHPQWQAGGYNGVGGKIRDGEDETQAMVREFNEEASVETELSQWVPLAFMKGPSWKCYTFFTHDTRFHEAKSGESELVGYFHVDSILGGVQRINLIHSLRYLIPLALDPDRPKVPIFEWK